MYTVPATTAGAEEVGVIVTVGVNVENVLRVVKIEVVIGAYYNLYDVIGEPLFDVTGVKLSLRLDDVTSVMTGVAGLFGTLERIKV